ncbi:thiamine biosynthesis protein ThiH [Chitinispirillum alkaliphilum]|nr:thiamine biosynthesis protein ThiH [Chitinispirillum alkaliphilum]
MSFHEQFQQYADFDFDTFFSSVSDHKVRCALSSNRLTPFDFLTLISDAASPYLEEMACRARDITRRQFGNVIFLFTPIYVSNICENVCPYCSFSIQNKIPRKHLPISEVRREAQRISSMGIRHILLLTGESRRAAGVGYLKECVRVLKEFFSSISIEVYPLSQSEYSELINCGVDGLTIYQETYNEPLYKNLHRGGPKEDFLFRLLAPERACKGGIRSVTVGALLGLHNPYAEVFYSAVHALYLQSKYPSTEISLSFPRLRPFASDFPVEHSVNDRKFVQFIVASRIFLNTVGITVSTRESGELRDSILPMGPTKMSAGVSTYVGHKDSDSSVSQFEIADERSVEQLKQDLLSFGFQPVMHDWNFRYVRDSVI